MKYPQITSYPLHAHSFSILSSNNQLGELYNSFIQLVAWHEQQLDFYDFNYKSCPYINYQRIHKRYLGSIIDFTIEALKNGNYVYLVVNTKHIAAYNNTTESAHDMLIYGYDSFDKTFYIADNFRGKYEFQTCSISELELSTRNLTDIQENYQGFNKCIELIEYNYLLEGEFKKERVVESIKDYIDCKHSSYWYSHKIKWEDRNSHTFGQNVYEVILKDLYNRKMNSINNPYDLRNYHLLWEHKNFMSKRLQYLFENSFIKNNDYIYSQIGSLAEKSLILRNLFIKYNISGRNDLLDTIYSGYSELRENDIATMTELLHLLN